MDKFEKLMQEYETLANTNLNLALEKMIDLYFDESYANSFNHEVYDGIKMWLYHEADDSHISYINSHYDRNKSGCNRLVNIIKTGIENKRHKT